MASFLSLPSSPWSWSLSLLVITSHLTCRSLALANGHIIQPWQMCVATVFACTISVPHCGLKADGAQEPKLAYEPFLAFLCCTEQFKLSWYTFSKRSAHKEWRDICSSYLRNLLTYRWALEQMFLIYKRIVCKPQASSSPAYESEVFAIFSFHSTSISGSLYNKLIKLDV